MRTVIFMGVFELYRIGTVLGGKEYKDETFIVLGFFALAFIVMDMVDFWKGRQ